MLVSLLWYRLAGFAGPDWSAIRTVVLLNLAVIVFVTHAYETWFFAGAAGSPGDPDESVSEERRLRLEAEAERDALESQFEPALLINTLSAVTWMIGQDPSRAQELSATLGRVYRYILTSRGRDLVLLGEEMAFIQDYLALLAVRFDDAVSLDIRIDDGALQSRMLPPVVLRALVENALNRNAFSRQQPLRLDLQVRRDEVVLSNPRQGHRQAEPPTPGALALRAVADRFRLATAAEIDVTALPNRLSVRLPLLAS
jgi:LytS/YehU family sensor histidine kinase